MNENTNNQPIARTGAAKPQSAQNQKPVATAAPQPAPGADMFKYVYREQKLQNQQAADNKDVSLQKPAAQQYAMNAAIPVVNAEKIQQESEKNKKFNIVFIILIIMSIVILAASLVVLFMDKSTEPAGEIESIPEETNTVSATLTSPFNYTKVYGVDFPAGMKEEFKDLYAQNQDFVGWLTVPGTCIDTPVYQCMTEELYYLKHDNYNTYTKYGIPFIDTYHDISVLSRNTTIYGHNFDHELIFDELHNYQDPEYFKKYPIIEYSTLFGDYKFKIIAAFHTNGASEGDNNYLFYYVAPEFGDKCMMEFYDELQQRSYIHTGVDVQPTDKLITLSTCTYFFDKNGSTQNARFAVIARLVRDGESEAIDESLVKANDNVRYPQLYYTVFGGTNPWTNASKWVPEAE